MEGQPSLPGSNWTPEDEETAWLVVLANQRYRDRFREVYLRKRGERELAAQDRYVEFMLRPQAGSIA